MNGSMEKWFRTTVGVKQGSSVTHMFFQIFLEPIMYVALEAHDGKASTGGRNITNMR